MVPQLVLLGEREVVQDLQQYAQAAMDMSCLLENQEGKCVDRSQEVPPRAVKVARMLVKIKSICMNKQDGHQEAPPANAQGLKISCLEGECMSWQDTHTTA